ncbi:MAG: 3-deoxy-D-manno-octulosonic acid transferase [Nitrospinae bacterium]|nr:3-deoxy-D-manno-octulosonic acid transferase [Nitrospinota bacterium]
MSFLYNLALLFGLTIFIPYIAWRLFSGKETMESVKQKLGIYPAPPPAKGGIWIHAVSVGETKAAIPLVEMLAKSGKPVIFSASTRTGMGLARDRLAGKAAITYFPFDFPFAVKKAVTHFSPAVAVMMETELWPNFLRSCAKEGCKTVLINGRISDRSFGRYRQFRPFIAPVLENMDMLLMQSRNDAERIAALGARPDRVRAAGNIKFDIPLPAPEEKPAMRKKFGLPEGKTAVIFASIHPGEDELLLETARHISSGRNDLCFVIAPRHIERAQKLAETCRTYGFIPVLRSSGKPLAEGSILVMDTIGELAQAYGAADIAVIGGSFVPHGGQNPLEAAAWGVPVAFGPHMENFREITQKLLESGGAQQVAKLADLNQLLQKWLADPATRSTVGKAGRTTVSANRGALEMTKQGILELLGDTKRE